MLNVFHNFVLDLFGLFGVHLDGIFVLATAVGRVLVDFEDLAIGSG